MEPARGTEHHRGKSRCHVRGNWAKRGHEGIPRKEGMARRVVGEECGRVAWRESHGSTEDPTKGKDTIGALGAGIQPCCGR